MSTTAHGAFSMPACPTNGTQMVHKCPPAGTGKR
nr:MAG TPA: hypothetical protein [Caudoviricetes sp.]